MDINFKLEDQWTPPLLVFRLRVGFVAFENHNTSGILL